MEDRSGEYECECECDVRGEETGGAGLVYGSFIRI